MGHGGTTSKVNKRRVSKNSTNDNRALQLWEKARQNNKYRKKKDTRKGMGYNKGWGTCTNIRIY